MLPFQMDTKNKYLESFFLNLLGKYSRVKAYQISCFIKGNDTYAHGGVHIWCGTLQLPHAGTDFCLENKLAVLCYKYVHSIGIHFFFSK